MALPRTHREEIEGLARQWHGLVTWTRRGARVNHAATAAIVLCGGALLIFPEALSASATPVTVVTGGFLWGGWYKMYKVGADRRRQRAQVAEMDRRIAELCGEGSRFEGDAAVVVAGGRPYDPFADESYD